MRANAVPALVDRTLKKIKNIANSHDFILAGGTALAYQLNHRISIDLDFFTQKPINANFILDQLKQNKVIYDLQAESQGTLHLLINGVKASFFQYPYPFIERTIKIHKMAVAHILDIASMKIVAVCQRGSRKDFVDLYFILQDFPFRKIALNMLGRYGIERVNPINIGKGLTYFFDADLDPEVNYSGSQRPDWGAVKKFFKSNVRQLVYDVQAVMNERAD